MYSLLAIVQVPGRRLLEMQSRSRRLIFRIRG
jgi:hypothetical protein